MKGPVKTISSWSEQKTWLSLAILVSDWLKLKNLPWKYKFKWFVCFSLKFLKYVAFIYLLIVIYCNWRKKNLLVIKISYFYCRRPLATRERIVHNMSAKQQDDHHFILYLNSQAGTYPWSLVSDSLANLSSYGKQNLRTTQQEITI